MSFFAGCLSLSHPLQAHNPNLLAPSDSKPTVTKPLPPTSILSANTHLLLPPALVAV